MIDLIKTFKPPPGGFLLPALSDVWRIRSLGGTGDEDEWTLR
ncbi:hypothetical protein [Candidatus Pantoea soli]|nr:hypothetical protein [Pantoea soli]